MEIGVVMAFWGVVMLIIIAPGADWAYAITGGMNHRAVPAVLGMLTGHSLGVLVVAAGVGAVVASHPAALTILTVGGAGYLIYLGIGSLRAADAPGAGQTDLGSGWRWWAKGVGVSGMNPKVLLLFLAVFPQFARPDAAWPVAVQLLALGAIHLVCTAIVYSAVGLGAGAVLSARPGAAKLVGRLSGVTMLVIGGGLLAEHFLG